MNESNRINTTKNYALFSISEDNRAINIKRRKTLRESMTKHGFLPAYPIVCSRTEKGLVIKDGQHRYTIARELGLPIHYVVSADVCDIADINAAQKPWGITDYANRFAKSNNADYIELLEFSEETGIPISLSATILFGHAKYGNFNEIFKQGGFKIREREYANKCARIVMSVRDQSKSAANPMLIYSVAAACRVEGFKEEKMIAAIKRRSDLLKPYANREACLDMLEKIYNHHSSVNALPLKFEAEKALRERNVAKNKVTK